MPLSAHELTEQFKAHKADWDDAFKLRMHRALSWYKASEQLQDDDLSFVTMWIALNAAYANDINVQQLLGEKGRFRDFIDRVCANDHEGKLKNCIWGMFSQSIRILLNNPYVFQGFWDAQNPYVPRDSWKEAFDSAKRLANDALGSSQTDMVLIIVFQRLYTLRNQIVHGGATYASSANRAQLKDACAILKAILPITLEIMMQNPHLDWGVPCYPLIQEE